MFTGLIEEVGVVARRSGMDLAVLAKTIMADLKLGDSVAINGACLTVAALTDDGFVVQMSPESLERTTLGRLRPGDAVNLERAMAANGRFGGHFVLGHVDGTGRVVRVTPQGDFSLWRFQAAAEIARYLIPKGSIAIDGISLTVIEPAGDTFGVAVIPTTIAHTTLASRRPGDEVNLETDVLAKHVYHLVKGSNGSGNVTMDLLRRQGFA